MPRQTGTDISAKQGEESRVWQQTLKFLKYRPRTCAEIRRHLSDKNFSPEAIASTLNRLKDLDLVNDLEFARRWVENRARFRPKGTYALRIELKKKGIADDIIDAVIQPDDEEKNARAALHSRLIRWKRLDKDKLRQKILTFLRSRGFSYSICNELCDQIMDEFSPENSGSSGDTP